MRFRHYTRDTISPFTESLRELACSARYGNADPVEFSHVFVAFDESKPVAFAGLACYRGHWCLRACVVHPDHRGQGLQRKLIRRRLEWLWAKKVKHVNVWARPDNVYSLNNLVSEGFRFVPEKPREFKGVMHVKLRRVL